MPATGRDHRALRAAPRDARQGPARARLGRPPRIQEGRCLHQDGRQAAHAPLHPKPCAKQQRRRAPAARHQDATANKRIRRGHMVQPLAMRSRPAKFALLRPPLHRGGDPKRLRKRGPAGIEATVGEGGTFAMKDGVRQGGRNSDCGRHKREKRPMLPRKSGPRSRTILQAPTWQTSFRQASRPFR